MTVLQIAGGATIVQVSQLSQSSLSIEDQAAPLLSQNPLLILNVEEISFSSMQIGELINLAKNFDSIWDSRSHSIGLLNLSPRSREIFEKTQLDQVFDLYDSISDAFNRFQRGTN